MPRKKIPPKLIAELKTNAKEIKSKIEGYDKVGALKVQDGKTKTEEIRAAKTWLKSKLQLEQAPETEQDVLRYLDELTAKEGRTRPTSTQVTRITRAFERATGKNPEKIKAFKEAVAKKVETNVLLSENDIQQIAEKHGTQLEAKQTVEIANTLKNEVSPEFVDIPKPSIFPEEEKPESTEVYVAPPETPTRQIYIQNATPLDISKSSGTQTASNIASSAAKQAIERNVASKATTAIASRLAFLGGPGSAIASALISRFGPDAISWTKRKSKWVIAGALGIPAFIFGGVGLGLVLGAGGYVIGGGLSAGGVGNALSSAGNTAASFATGLASASFGTIKVPVIVAMFATPIIIAVIIFIINSGAYVVPPATGPGGIISDVTQSPYIRVTKEILGGNNIPNENLPATTQYKITVSATLGALANIEFKNECNVTKEIEVGETKPPCNAPTPTEIPETITPTQPFEFIYEDSYNLNYLNTIITDTFTVSADPAGANERQTSASTATLIIGEPPLDCFEVVGNWPADYKSKMLSAITTLNTQFPTYSAKVCSSGTIRVEYAPGVNPGGYGYYPGGDRIQFNGNGLFTVMDTLYILTHESGHYYVSQTSAGSGEFLRYKTEGVYQGEIPMCSYRNTSNTIESFPEMIALYVTREQTAQWRGQCGSKTFEGSYPKHFDYAGSVVFN